MPKAKPLPPPIYLFSPFAEREWERMERFALKVAFLQASEFPGASLNIVATPVAASGPMGGQGWTFGIEGPNEKEVKSVIGDFRQIYTNSNETSARAIAKLLGGHARKRETDVSRNLASQLKAFGKHLDGRKANDPRGFMLEEGHEGRRSPDSIVQDWFNGVYFHDNQSGFGLERDGHSTVEMFRWALHTAIKDFIQEWGSLRRLVEAILREPALRAG